MKLFCFEYNFNRVFLIIFLQVSEIKAIPSSCKVRGIKFIFNNIRGGQGQ